MYKHHDAIHFKHHEAIDSMYRHHEAIHFKHYVAIDSIDIMKLYTVCIDNRRLKILNIMKP